MHRIRHLQQARHARRPSPQTHPPINRLRAFCHDRKIPVSHTRTGFNEEYSDSGIQLEANPAIKDLRGFVRGTWDTAIVDELTPRDGETIVDKTRNTAFHGTGFADLLKARGINHLIVTGVGTNVCVESTARDAYTLDFHVVTVRDATATVMGDDIHEASLQT